MVKKIIRAGKPDCLKLPRVMEKAFWREEHYFARLAYDLLSFQDQGTDD